MTADPFASSTLSLILAWVLTIPFLLGVLGTGFSMLFEKADDQIPRWFVVWIIVCIVVFSPLRYMILQVIIGTAYPVQSLSAFLSLFLLTFYIPIVFGLLYFIGVGVPLLATVRLSFGKLASPVITKTRLFFASILAPVAMSAGYVGFFWLLQYAAYSTHWLRADDLIGAANGPATVAYSGALKYLLPLPVSGYYKDVSNTDRDMLRNHIATFYLGRGAEARYVKLAYPELYRKLTTP